MSPRRLALGLVVAVTAATGLLGAGAARASTPTICVALVVDGRSLGSDVSTTCAKVPKGATGVDVLTAAGHRVGFRSDGLICTIDGLPKAGCAAVDTSHYWAYFHRAPGANTWTYSTEGPSTYQPVNASTEGWVYDDGTALTPKNVPYQQICRSAAKPTASSKPSPSPTRAQHASPPPAATPTPMASSTSAHPTTVAPGRPARSGQPRHSPSPSASASPSARPSMTAGSAASPAPSLTSGALVGGTAGGSSGSGPRDLVLVAVAVVLLGGGTVVAIRARRRSG